MMAAAEQLALAAESIKDAKLKSGKGKCKGGKGGKRKGKKGKGKVGKFRLGLAGVGLRKPGGDTQKKKHDFPEHALDNCAVVSVQ